MALSLRPHEEAVEVKPIGIRYRCEFCNEGFMEATNDPVIVPAVLTNPPQPIMRTHRCTKCGKTMQLPSVYPRIDWVIAEEEAKDET